MIAPVERAMAVEVDQRVRIAAPPERVWRALVNPADVTRWLFPSAVVDVREGGSWRFTFPHWPSARGLHHPALNFGGPIVELVPGRVLAVQFEPPYWGVLRFEVMADGDGTDMRVTQRGFEGNEEWLADFRGGWGSFTDRLALLCETGEVATARRLEATRAVDAHARARRARRSARAARAASAARAPLLVRRRRHGSRSCFRAWTPRPATQPRREEPCNALCVDAARRAPTCRRRARASSARCPAAAGRLPARCARRWIPRTPRPVASSPSPTAPPSLSQTPSRSCAPSSAPSARPGAPRRPPTSPPAARSRWPAGRTRGRSTRRSRASPQQAVARFWRLRLGSDGVLSADWEGSGWTAGRNRGTSTWTFAADGRIERLVLRFDPAVPRMVAA